MQEAVRCNHTYAQERKTHMYKKDMHVIFLCTYARERHICVFRVHMCLAITHCTQSLIFLPSYSAYVIHSYAHVMQIWHTGTVKALSGDTSGGKDKPEKKRKKNADESAADSKIEELFASSASKRKARG